MVPAVLHEKEKAHKVSVFTLSLHSGVSAQDAAHDAAHGLRTITSPAQHQQHHYHHNQLWYQPWRQMTHQLSFYKSSYHTTTRCSQMLMMWCPLLLCMMGEAPSAILVLVSFVPLLKLIYYKYSVASLLSFPFVKYIPSSLPIIHPHLLPIKSIMLLCIPLSSLSAPIVFTLY